MLINRIEQQFGAEEDLKVLLSGSSESVLWVVVIDDFFYQTLNNEKISFDHFSIPQEYYGIFMHFRE